jgi:hypothetical protein
MFGQYPRFEGVTNVLIPHVWSMLHFWAAFLFFLSLFIPNNACPPPRFLTATGFPSLAGEQDYALFVPFDAPVPLGARRYAVVHEGDAPAMREVELPRKGKVCRPFLNLKNPGA